MITKQMLIKRDHRCKWRRKFIYDNKEPPMLTKMKKSQHLCQQRIMNNGKHEKSHLYQQRIIITNIDENSFNKGSLNHNKGYSKLSPRKKGLRFKWLFFKKKSLQEIRLEGMQKSQPLREFN